MGLSMSNTGLMYWSIADSIFQLLGTEPLVKSEKVKWYVPEYFMDRVILFERDSSAPWKPCCCRSEDIEDVARK
jgi:hypothetical protein